jgi:radical SAM protein with 4Fe4S-binding SPASM domain
MPPSDDEPGRQVFCSKPWTSFEVEHDGTVMPCCMAKTACGNVLQNSIAEIWNGERFQEFRQKMAEGRWQETCRPECPRLYGTIDDSAAAPQAEEFAGNYALNLVEIAQRATVLRSQPRIWKTTASTLCNIDCIMCYQDREDRRSLPESFYGDLAGYYPYLQEVQIIGGEPFAIRRLRDLMAGFPKAQFPDAKFSIVSNGSIHDPKTVGIVRGLSVSWMSISVDAASEATYARIRRGGDFATTMAGAQKWIELGRELGFPVHLAFTVMRDNVTEMDAFVELACGLGADVLFGRIAGTKGDQHLIDPEALATSVARTRAFLAPRESIMPLAILTLASSC